MTPAQLNDFHPDFPLDDHVDVILCSSDNQYFGTHSITLRNASPFFRDMLSLPPPSTAQVEGLKTGSDLPILRLDEDATIVQGLLHMVSAMEIPLLNNMETIVPLLHAAEKYDMRGPRSIIRATIMSPQLRGQALQIFALTSKYGWKAEEEAISAHTHHFNLAAPQSEIALRGATGNSVLKLLQLHYARRFRLISCLQHSDIQDVAETYPCCGRSDHRWAHLSLRILLEMQSRCDVELISDPSFLEWPEMMAFANPRCFECRQTVQSPPDGGKGRLREMQQAFISVLEDSPKTIALEKENPRSTPTVAH